MLISYENNRQLVISYLCDSLTNIQQKYINNARISLTLTKLVEKKV